jgi:hypothetical protein
MLFVLAVTLVAQGNELIIANLSDKFGQISHSDQNSSHEYVFSGEFADIEYALNLANSNNMFVQFISVSAREDGKAAILIRVNSKRNTASQKFSLFSNLLKPGMFNWKEGELPQNMAVLTTIETSFDNTVTLQGKTLKSSLIFSHLFPMIERTGELRDPFFSHGSYADTAAGRVMDFTVRCNW